MVHNFYQIGGGEHTVFKNEVELLRDNGHEVIEYTRSNDELKSDKWKLLFLPFTTVWSLRTYIEIRKLIKNEQIDVVHCHNTFPLISPLHIMPRFVLILISKHSNVLIRCFWDNIN